MLRVRRRSPVFYQNLWGFAFAVPALILLVVFSVYPVLNALYIGFTSWSLSGTPEFIGLDNYITMFVRDPEFLRSLRTTAIYAVGLNPIMWAIALALALLFNQEMRMRGVFRTIFFTPVVVSWVVASMVWYLIFHRSFGLNAHIMRFFGQPGIKLLEDSQYALLAIIVLSLWKSMGYYMVLFLAGLQNISRVFYEAADVDGANSWQRFWHITLPLLMPATLFVMVISIINSFQVFTPIYLLTRGGPHGATRVLPMLIYENAFLFLKMGYASAMAMILFVILMALTLLQLRVFRSDVG